MWRTVKCTDLELLLGTVLVGSGLKVNPSYVALEIVDSQRCKSSSLACERRKSNSSIVDPSPSGGDSDGTILFLLESSGEPCADL